MPNLTSTVNLNSTVYKQATNGLNPFFNSGSTYNPTQSPVFNPLAKPAQGSTIGGLVNRPTAPSTISTAPTKAYDPGAAYSVIDSATTAISPGDGGVGDATAAQGGQYVKDTLQTIHNAQDKDQAIQDAKADPFYKDGTFWNGMLHAALKAYDGGSASDIFDAATQGFAQGKQEEEAATIKQNLAANQDDLLKQYTPDSVANAIATGNPSILRERKLSIEEQDARDQAKQDRQDAREDKRYANQLAMQDKREQAQEARYNARQDQLQANADAKQAQADAKQETKAEQFDRREIRANTADLRKNQTRNTGFEKADRHMEIFDNPKATNEQKAAAWQQGREEIYTAIQASSNAEKNMDKINEMLGRNGRIQKVGDQLSVEINGVPSDAAVSYLRELLRQDKEANMAVTTDRLYSQVGNYVDDPNDKSQVEKAINKVRRASGVTVPITYDGFKGWATGEETKPNPKGALSSSNTGGSSALNALRSQYLNK